MKITQTSNQVLTADTITGDQIRGLFEELTHHDRPIRPSNQDIRDIKFAANALGIGAIVEGVDCRMPHGYEAEYARRGRARCAEILNARSK